MPKTNIHPEWFSETPILCDGKPLGLIGSTKPELQVDMWLANHPFYTKSQVMIDSEGRVERFMKKLFDIIRKMFYLSSVSLFSTNLLFSLVQLSSHGLYSVIGLKKKHKCQDHH